MKPLPIQMFAFFLLPFFLFPFFYFSSIFEIIFNPNPLTPPDI